MINLHSQLPLPATRLPELVSAIFSADAEDENDWLEWKSTLDLTSLPGLFAISRAILGFANRDPAKTKQPFGGTAYLVVGVAPQQIEGVVPVDLETLSSKLARYLGTPGPFWRHHYVPPVEDPDLRVLVVEIPPPRDGEYPFPLRTAYAPADKKEKAGAASGALFVRRGSSTERANYDEVLTLVDRAVKASQPIRLHDLGLVMTVTSPSAPLRSAQFTTELTAAWLQRRRSIMLNALKRAPGPPVLGWTRLVSDVESSQYALDVDAYLSSCGPQLPGLFLTEMFNEGYNGLVIDVDNASEEVLADVEVKLVLPPEFHIIDPQRLERRGLPDPPAPPGQPSYPGWREHATMQKHFQATGLAPPPRFPSSPRQTSTGAHNIYRENVGDIRGRDHRHTCTMQVLIPAAVTELMGTVSVTSPSFPGVVDFALSAQVVPPDDGLLDELVPPDPAHVEAFRPPRFPPTHHH